jgi:hypothetical protein
VGIPGRPEVTMSYLDDDDNLWVWEDLKPFLLYCCERSEQPDWVEDSPPIEVYDDILPNWR